MSLPSRGEALEMLRDAGCSKSVIGHCRNVTEVAMRIAAAFKRRGFDVDLDLIETGALMHDIGRSRTHGVEHGAVGGELARRIGLPENLARIIERHVGAGITAEEAKKIGLSGCSYVPETLEEKIVAYADKLVEGNRQVDIEITVEKFAKELGVDHPALERLRALHLEVVSLIGHEF